MGGISLRRCHQLGVLRIEEAGPFPPQLHDFEAVALSKLEADSHFAQLQGLLETLGLQEARHKASPLPRSWCAWDFSFTT